jgi:methionyl-tRNA formyltransferase
MNIVFLGSGEFGIRSLDAVLQSRHRLLFIVTQPPHPAGRGRRPTPTAVARWADTHSILYVETDNANTESIIESVTEYKPDLILVIAFGQKIGNELISLPPKGAINVHASLLPKLRGAAPINWAIINGESQTGVSIITLAERMDAGKILSQDKVYISPNETTGELHDKLAELAASLLLKTLDGIEASTATYTEQDHSRATLAPKLKKSDGFLDFSESAELIERKIRGFWPWPGASAEYVSKKTDKSERVIIAMAEVVEINDRAGLPIGALDGDLNVICGSDAVRITKIKPAGSHLMDFADFVNGRHCKPGDRFVKIEHS